MASKFEGEKIVKNIHYGIGWAALIAGICFLVVNNQHEWAIFLAILLVVSNPSKDN